MNSKIIYKESLDFLHNNLPHQVTKIDLDEYLTQSFYQPTRINDVYLSFVHSLQNYQSLPNIIKFEERESIFSYILYDFDPKLVYDSYTFDSLYTLLYNSFQFSNYEKKNNLWIRYTKGLLSAAKFLSDFDNYKDFDDFVKSFRYNEISSASLPMLLEKEIYGMGFALACDCLKELGYTHYPKPDIHLIDIFKALGLSDGTPFNTYKSIIKMANTVNETPYKVDKIFWLISSGKYYLHQTETKRLKKELIEHLKTFM